MTPNPPFNRSVNLPRKSRHFYLTLGKEVSEGKPTIEFA
jgi:hypothetical protein